MNYTLFEKYGSWGDDGHFITDHEKYHYYQHHAKERKRIKIKAWLSIMCIPMLGIIAANEYYKEIGESFV